MMNNQTNQRQAKNGYAFQWVLLTTLGWTFGQAVGTAGLLISLSRPPYIGFCISNSLLGIILGTLQFRVLNRILKSQVKGWVLSSTLGCFLGALLSSFVLPAINNNYLASILHGAISGTVVSSMQWYVLRRWISKPQSWILANTLSWATAEFLLSIFYRYPKSKDYLFSLYGVVTEVLGLKMQVVALIGGLIISLFTWFSTIWTFQQFNGE